MGIVLEQRILGTAILGGLADTGTDPHRPLREDVGLLGELLGETLRAHGGQDLFDAVERVRALAKSARRGDAKASERLSAWFGAMPLELAVPIARAFAHFLALANIAEQHHRIRRRRDHRRAADRPQRGSSAEAFGRFVAAGVPRDELARTVRRTSIELVLTAHPTEIVRRTLIHKHNRIAGLLSCRDRADLTPAERAESLEAMRREIASAWQTDETRSQGLSPLDEVRAGLLVFEQSLWDAVPAFLREVDRTLAAAAGEGLPLGATPVRFGSWIGGDRDGNPNVTPEVTRQATWLARWSAAHLYLDEIEALRDELSITAATDELRARTNGAREPYRALLREVRDRLRATRAWAETQLAPTDGSGNGLARGESESAGTRPFRSADEFAEPLLACFRSLEATGNGLIARGRLTDVLRRVSVFGLVLARLDLRQEAARHAEAVDWLLRESARDGPAIRPAADREPGGVPCASFASADEDTRQHLLTRLLVEGDAGPARVDLARVDLTRAPSGVRDVLETFRVAAGLSPDSLGAYIVTMASRASDVLAVEFLQAAAGNPRPQRVVPLFETSRDLAAADRTLQALFANPWYRRRVRKEGRQEVMIGYSDSAKEAGRFSAAWTLYRAQEDIVETCRAAGVELTLFHGRGGSVGRGGGPTALAIQSQPPGSIRGSLRVTEQGEMIQAKFGLPDIAQRTLEVYLTATLEATLLSSAAPSARWREAMDRLSEQARRAYRECVYENPRFLPYFRQATPEPELGTLSLGSRPALRPSGEGLESLRAIPWQFAWTQTRLLLASWLGVETALTRAFDRGDQPLLSEMYREWPFFRSTVDLIEMALAKADPRIAAMYDRALVEPELRAFGDELRNRLALAVSAILRVAGHRELAEGNPVLRRSIDVRNPYVDPINLVQIELLRRLRAASGAESRGREAESRAAFVAASGVASGADERVRRAFAVSVNGIAAGMRNTG